MPKVLVCEDDFLVRRLLIEALEIGGYEVTSVADGEEALKIIETGHEFEVILTDFAMPKADGIQVIRKSKQVDPTVPCLVITAYRDFDVAMRGMEEGAIGFIPKPFQTQQLLSIVERAFERRGLELEAMRLKVEAPILEQFVTVLASTLESKDFQTQKHSKRVMWLSDMVGEKLGMSQAERERLRLGAVLHDIGKIAIDEAILQKPAILDFEESEAMRQHPIIGAKILSSVDGWTDVQKIVLHHHENFDGTGYPFGLKGEDIPIGARIVGVADTFDVVRAGRRYAAARSLEEAVSELIKGKGKQFDPEIVDLFCGVVLNKEVEARYLRELEGEGPTDVQITGSEVPNEGRKQLVGDKGKS